MFYWLDDRQLSTREVWRFSPSLGVFFWFLIRTRVLHAHMIRGVTATRLEAISRQDPALFPDEARTALASRLSDLEAVQWPIVLADAIPRYSDEAGYRVVARSPDALVVAVVLYARKGNLARTSLILQSRLADGVLLATGDAPRRFDAAPGIAAESVRRGLPVERMIRRHRSRLSGAGPVVPIQDNDLEPLLLQTNHRVIDHQLERGLLTPMSNSELQRARQVLLPPLRPLPRPRPALWFGLLTLVALAQRFVPGSSNTWTNAVLWAATAGFVLTLRKPGWGR